MARHGALKARFVIETDGSTNFMTRIEFLNDADAVISLENCNPEFMAIGQTNEKGSILIGAMVMDWPPETSLSILATQQMELMDPQWDRAKPNPGVLEIGLDGTASFTPLNKALP